MREGFGWRIALGDINGDGLADLAVTSWGDADLCTSSECFVGVTVYLGRRDATMLSEPTRIRTLMTSRQGLAAVAIAIEDLNGDGFGDVVATSMPSPTGWAHLAVYLGGPEGVRTAPINAMNSTSNVDLSPDTAKEFLLGVGDLDGDGFGDLIDLRADAGSLAVMGGPDVNLDRRSVPLNLAGGTILNRTSLSSFDFNGDGDVDVVSGFPRNVMQSSRGSLALVQAIDDIDIPFGTISSGFIRVLHGESRIASPGDLNGDGFGDLVEIEFCIAWEEPRSRCTHDEVRAHLSDGSSVARSSVWAHEVSHPVFTTPAIMAARAGVPGDVDGDGYDDIIVVEHGTLTVFAGGALGPTMRSALSIATVPIQHPTLNAIW